MIKYEYKDSAKIQAVKLNKFESIDYSSDNDLIHPNHAPDALNVIRDNNMKIKIRDGLSKDFLEELLKKTTPESDPGTGKNFPININEITEIINFVQHGKNFIISFKKTNGFYDIHQILYRPGNKYENSVLRYYKDKIPTGLYTLCLGSRGEEPYIQTYNMSRALTCNQYVKDENVFIIADGTILKLTYLTNLTLEKNCTLDPIPGGNQFTDSFINEKYYCSKYPFIPKIRMSCGISADTRMTAVNSDMKGKSCIFEYKANLLLYPNIISKRVCFTINEHNEEEFYTEKDTYILMPISKSFIDSVEPSELEKWVKANDFANQEFTTKNQELVFRYMEYVDMEIYYKTFNKGRNSDYEITSTDVYVYDARVNFGMAPMFMRYSNDRREYFLLMRIMKFSHSTTGRDQWLNTSEEFKNQTDDTMYIELNFDNNVINKFGNLLSELDQKCLSLHGTSGNLSQLVISGSQNSLYKNYIFYSQKNELDYFPAPNYRSIGESISQITGFNRSEFGLVVHKDFSETKAYVLTFDDEKISDKQIVCSANVKYAFPANTCVSKKSCETLNESLYLSNIGIQGIIPSQTMNQNIIQVSRGERINNLLFQEPDISKAIAFVYKTYYMLALNNKIFILDMYSQQRNVKQENVTVENNPEKYQLSAFFWIFPEIKRIKSIFQFESGVTMIVEVSDQNDPSKTVDRIYQLKDTMNFLHQNETQVDSSDWYWYTKRFEGNGFEFKKQLLGVSLKYKGFTKDDFKIEIVIDKSKKNTIPIIFNEETKSEYSEKEITSTQIFNNLSFIQFKISNSGITPIDGKMKRFTLIELNFKYKERGRRVISNEKELIS